MAKSSDLFIIPYEEILFPIAELPTLLQTGKAFSKDTPTDRELAADKTFGTSYNMWLQTVMADNQAEPEDFTYIFKTLNIFRLI